jgi:hypothetical protein
MIDVKVEIDDKQIMDFCKKSPKRAQWAMSEALKMAGGHYRKKMRAFIEGGGENWKALHPVTKKGKSPLFNLGKMVGFKYGKSKGAQRVQIGFFGKRPAKLARELGYGKKLKITEGIRGFFARRGVFLKKTTKYITLPARAIIEPFWRKITSTAPAYIEKRFFEKFFSK